MAASTTSHLSQVERLRLAGRQRFFLRSAAFGLVALFAAASVFALGLGYREYRSLGSSPAVLPPLVATDGLHGSRVEWRGHSGLVRAWYSKGSTGSAVVLAHGSNGNRSALATEFFALRRAGFSVLSLDLPGHGESEGQVDYSGQNLKAIREAVDFLLAKGEQKIGLFGFSLGGYQAVQAAAEDLRIAALAVAGTPADLEKQACSEYPLACRITLAPVVFSMSLRGLRGNDRPALLAIEKLRGRPLLVIEGSDDRVVPKAISQPLFDRAGAPKQRLVVDGAGHGDYGSHAAETYPKALSDFFRQALNSSLPAVVND